MCPVGAGWLLEAEKGTSLLVDPGLAVNGVPRVLRVSFYDATWEGEQVESSKRM